MVVKENFIRKVLLMGAVSCSCILLGCRDTQNENLTRERTNNIEKQQEAVADIDQIDESRIIENQSFDIELNQWGKVRFVSCLPDIESNPLADATFWLMDGDKIVYRFPSINEDDISTKGIFDDVSFVAFKDINKDDKDEVIIGTLFETGAGPQGNIPRTQVRVFQDNGDSFEYCKELSEYITLNVPEDADIHDVYKQITRYNIYELDMASLYKHLKPVSNPKSFEGNWHATNCHSALSGDVTISNQTNEGFHYEGFFSYYSHSGEAIGEAHFVTDSIAISNQDDIEDSMEDGYMIFYMVDDSLYLRADTYFGCMGMNVSPNNEYTLGKPEYTNADMVNRTYSKEQLAEIKGLLGADLYDDPFIFGTEQGSVTTSEKTLTDGTKCKYVECYILTMGENYEAVLADDGRIYIKIHSYDGDELFINDSGWESQELPELKDF